MNKETAQIVESNPALLAGCQIMTAYVLEAEGLVRVSELDAMPATRMAAIGSDTGAEGEQVTLETAGQQVSFEGMVSGGDASLDEVFGTKEGHGTREEWRAALDKKNITQLQ